jgi:TPP-dependent pyruvate/acetoin dehydrogenase alpha subunit
MTTTATDPRLQLEQHLHMYRQMAKIRAFEEQVNELYKGAKMPGLAHLYVGEEAVAVGVYEALSRPRCGAAARSRCASSATARWARACSTTR